MLSENENAYKFRIVEMKDQKESYRFDTFDVSKQLSIVNVTQIDKDSILIFGHWEQILYCSVKKIKEKNDSTILLFRHCLVMF